MSPRSAERRELFPAPTLPTTATREPRGILTLMLSRVGALLVFFSFSLLASPLEVVAELQAKEALENCVVIVEKSSLVDMTLHVVV